MDQDIRPAQQTLELLFIPRLSQVKCHSSFVRVQGKKETTLLHMGGAGRERATVPSPVALRLFNFYDIGS
jgi:hypothetical protein